MSVLISQWVPPSSSLPGPQLHSPRVILAVPSPTSPRPDLSSSLLPASVKNGLLKKKKKRMAQFSLRSRLQARGWALAEVGGRKRPTTGRGHGHRQSGNQGVWERRFHIIIFLSESKSHPSPALPSAGTWKERQEWKKNVTDSSFCRLFLLATLLF